MPSLKTSNGLTKKRRSVSTRKLIKVLITHITGCSQKYPKHTRFFRILKQK
jgi:hypothetical protein